MLSERTRTSELNLDFEWEVEVFCDSPRDKKWPSS